MNKNYTKITLALVLVGVIAIAGCTSETAYTNEPEQNSNSGATETEDVASEPEETLPKVQTIGDVFITAENWDADAEVDGLEFTLNPEDRNGKLVETPGTVVVKIWQPKCTEYLYGSCMDTSCVMEDEYLIETMTVPLTTENYDMWGATIRAEYKTYQVTSDEFKTGCVKVNLTTPDGKSFVALDDSVYLNGL